jgi:hypothetical protein
LLWTETNITLERDKSYTGRRQTLLWTETNIALERDKRYTETGRRLNWKGIRIAVERDTVPFSLQVSLNTAVSKHVQIKL